MWCNMLRRLFSFRNCFWLGIAASLIIAYGLVQSYRFVDPSLVSVRAPVADPDTPRRSVPLRVSPVRFGLIDVPEHVLEACLGKIRPPREADSASLYLHLLRLHGLSARFAHPELVSGDEILALFLDAERGRSFFGAPIVVRTRYGAAFVGGGDNLAVAAMSTESHRDQCLSALAEQRIPLSRALSIDGSPLELRHVLEDSIANFHLAQQELQWTALAYSLYLPPQTHWANKFGERTTFNDLADTLLSLALEDSSCAGTHLVFALTVMYRVDQEHHPILSAGMRARVKERLWAYTAAAINTQEQDGSWPLDWHRLLARPLTNTGLAPDLGDPNGRLLVTGHLAEWLLYVPEEFSVPDDCLSRAGSWLLSKLKEVSDDAAVELICPYTHAACVVNVLSANSSGAGAPRTFDKVPGRRAFLHQ